MKKFAIITDQNHIEAMKKILSDCRVSGRVAPEIERYLEKSRGQHKTYNCRVAGNKLSVTMPMPYRNITAPTMSLEILVAGGQTRINGSVGSPLSGEYVRKIIVAIVLLGLLGCLVLMTIGFFTASLALTDWICAGAALIAFLALFLTTFAKQKNNAEVVAVDPYQVQLEHWIEGLFPGECKILAE